MTDGGASAVRRFPLPPDMRPPACLFRDASILKSDPDYAAAKAGDGEAAVRFVTRLAPPLVPAVRAMKQPGTTIIVPHAEEAAGDNAIPQVLGGFLAAAANTAIALGIIQTSRAFHTGADPMERLISRPRFSGPVAKGTPYLLVDDVSTLGGTLAELADYVQASGGLVAGIAVLANASRSGHLVPERRIVRLLENRFGDIIREALRIEPNALTRDEAQYLVGFRTPDELRNRAAKARAARIDRVGACSW